MHPKLNLAQELSPSTIVESKINSQRHHKDFDITKSLYSFRTWKYKCNSKDQRLNEWMMWDFP